ncbi:MAG: hypothetical protein K0R97_3277 [Oerskovia sp.]|nr:hypothetical protein [Oerskovia sp.]
MTTISVTTCSTTTRAAVAQKPRCRSSSGHAIRAPATVPRARWRARTTACCVVVPWSVAVAPIAAQAGCPNPATCAIAAATAAARATRTERSRQPAPARDSRAVVRRVRRGGRPAGVPAAPESSSARRRAVARVRRCDASSARTVRARATASCARPTAPRSSGARAAASAARGARRTASRAGPLGRNRNPATHTAQATATPRSAARPRGARSANVGAPASPAPAAKTTIVAPGGPVRRSWHSAVMPPARSATIPSATQAGAPAAVTAVVTRIEPTMIAPTAASSAARRRYGSKRPYSEVRAPRAAKPARS